MKKYIFSIIATGFLATSCLAQIPNNGFESWTNMGTYDNPDNWGTLNNSTSDSSIFTAVKGTPGSPGDAYLKLSSKIIGSTVINGIAVSGLLDSIAMKAKSGFAYALRPVSFTGKWQHMIFGSSQGSVSVVLTRWDTGTNARVMVAAANHILSGMSMSWTAFSIPFTYTDSENPDTCIITLKASGSTPTNNDYLWVDDLAFSFATGINERGDFLSSMNIYPNPGNENIVLDLNFKKAEQTTIELTDMNGKIVLSKNAGVLTGESRQTFNISDIAKGSYFVRIVTASGTEIKKIVIQ